jgi:hypothetical protein
VAGRRTFRILTASQQSGIDQSPSAVGYLCALQVTYRRGVSYNTFTYLVMWATGSSKTSTPTRCQLPENIFPHCHCCNNFTLYTFIFTFPGVKRPGRDIDHPTPYSAEVKERAELYLYSPYGPSWPVIG